MFEKKNVDVGCKERIETTFQAGQLSVSGERTCTILVNHLED